MKQEAIMFDRFFSRCIWSVFTSFLIVALVPTFCTAAFAQSNKASIKNPVILVVGTYHLGDDREDVTTPQRQKEIEEVVALLKKFRPTKVAVEVLFDSPTI